MGKLRAHELDDLQHRDRYETEQHDKDPISDRQRADVKHRL